MKIKFVPLYPTLFLRPAGNATARQAVEFLQKLLAILQKLSCKVVKIFCNFVAKIAKL